MRRFLHFIAIVCTLLGTPGYAETELTAAQEQAIARCLAPMETAMEHMGQAADLMEQVLENKTTAQTAAPELKRLLDSVEQQRKIFFDQQDPVDEKVSEVLSLWLLWNGEKLSGYNSILIQLGNELLNLPGTDSELLAVLESCFFAKDLRRLSQYSAEDLARAEAELKPLKETGACLRECILVLNSITSKEEADAAAPRLQQLLDRAAALYGECSQITPQNATNHHQEIVNTLANTYGFPLLLLRVTAMLEKMMFYQNCYGSETLKKVLEKF